MDVAQRLLYVEVQVSCVLCCAVCFSFIRRWTLHFPSARATTRVVDFVSSFVAVSLSPMCFPGLYRRHTQIDTATFITVLRAADVCKVKRETMRWRWLALQLVSVYQSSVES